MGLASDNKIKPEYFLPKNELEILKNNLITNIKITFTRKDNTKEYFDFQVKTNHAEIIQFNANCIFNN